MSLRLRMAVGLGRAAGAASRALRVGGGTTVPGLLARKIEPAVTGQLARRLKEGAILVSGTNGKTTTSRLLAAIRAAEGLGVVHNRAGANLMTGVTTALLKESGDTGIFEVDEATLPHAVAELQPRAVLCLNLFRDQLDRYGELDHVARLWAKALSELPESATAILNADDPRIANLGSDLACKVVYYGLDAPQQALPDLQHAADSLYCPRCGGLLRFEVVYYGHIGCYSCTSCGWSRPRPQVLAHDLQLSNSAPSRFLVRVEAHRSVNYSHHPQKLEKTSRLAVVGEGRAESCSVGGESRPGGADGALTKPLPLRRVRVLLEHALELVGLNHRRYDALMPGGPTTGASVGMDPRVRPPASGGGTVGTDETSEEELSAQLPGLYNVYNVLAAFTTAWALGTDAAKAREVIASFGGAFGRTEIVVFEGKQVRLLLAKNPVGFNEVIRTVSLDPAPLDLYLALNDRIADGQDVSWIWDVDFELLARRCHSLAIAGTRAEELAMRLKYAGFPIEQLRVYATHLEALRAAVDAAPSGGTVYAVPTYTAMLELRSALTKLGLVRQFWED